MSSRSHQEKYWALIPAALVVGGLIAFLSGARGALILRKLAAHGTEVEGTVVDIKTVHTSKGSRFKASIEFQTETGQMVTFEAGGGQYAPRYKRGANVPVLYDPDHPETARVGTRQSLERENPLMLMGIGGVFTAVGAILLWKLRATILPRQMRPNHQ